MPLYDLPLDALRAHRSAVVHPPDLDEFWRVTLDDARSHPLGASFVPIDVGLSALDVYDVTFAGWGGEPIKGWLLLPRARSESGLPCVVEYVGYGGGRGHAHDWLLWSAAGFAHLVMDTRGQGATWRRGDTADPASAGEPQTPGWLTRGVLSRETYYYRRLYTDAVRAVDAARCAPGVDPTRVVSVGASQGGGLALAASALDGAVSAVCADVPFLCDIRRASELTERLPYAELATYLSVQRDRLDAVFSTLAYFDVVNLVRNATAPALFSVALMDTVCPPSTVYAAYNAYGGPKQVREWPYNDHEGGQSDQAAHALAFVRETLRLSASPVDSCLRGELA